MYVLVKLSVLSVTESNGINRGCPPGRDAAGLHCIQIFAMLKGQEIKAPIKPASKPPQ